MAGIGFELVKLLQKNNYSGLLRAYSATILIGSGPGLLVLFSLGVVCFFHLFTIPTSAIAHQFLAMVIYLFSGSMIISSFLGYALTRFTADMKFVKQYDCITPNYIGTLLIQLLGSIFFIVPIVFYLFDHKNFILNLLFISSFCVLSMVWVSLVLLTEAKSYRRIVWGCLLGYSTMIILHFIFEQKQNDLTFLVFQFFLAQCILLMSLLYAILMLYPTTKLIAFDVLKKENFYCTLVLASFFYNLGFWIDKYLFWFNSHTGESVLSPLRLSPIYDFPMFVASLTMIPGIAVFMLQLESKFALIYPQVMSTIFKQKTLTEINSICHELVISGREMISNLIKAQSAMIIILFLSASYLFSIFNVLGIYLNLLFVLVVSAGLHVILWALLSLLYYMTNYLHAFYVALIFCVSNFMFTSLSLYAGPLYYGYGVSFSLLLAIIVALFLLDKNFKNLEYTTFMMVD